MKNREWKSFKIKKVTGKPIENYFEGTIPYISTASVNNGLIGFCKSNDISVGNTLSVDPIKGKCFYHVYNFVGRGFSGASINLLYNENLNCYNGLFISKMIEKTAEGKASYGNLFNSNRLANGKILLPVNKQGKPDFEFMEQAKEV